MNHRRFLYVLCLIALLTTVFAFHAAYDPISKRSEGIPVCGFGSDGPINPMENGKFIVALPGWGHYSYKISTRIDSAQFYFDQGLTMYYSYHMKEAVASFKEVTRLDPTCPMGYWGQALAGGPYYNSAHLYTVPQDMMVVLARMNELVPYANPKEKRLIQVMNTRYSADPADTQRKKLNLAYAEAFRQLLKEYDDPDSKMFYVDAVMLIHAWDFWTPDGKPRAWTQEVVDLCESVLKQYPNHPAALHYHIHLTEASRHPESAPINSEHSFRG